MPPDGGIPDSVFYPAMAAGAGAGAGVGFALPVIAGTGAVSTVSSGIGSALAYRSVQGAVGSVAIETIGQSMQGDFNAQKLGEQAIVGAVGGKWVSSARGFLNPRYSAMLAKSPRIISRAASTRAGHIAYELSLESAVASPLIAYGVSNDIRAGQSTPLGHLLLSNFVATKTGMKVALLGKYGGGKLTGVMAKKALNKVSPHILTVASNPGTYAGLTNHLRTNSSIQEPIHHLERELFGSINRNDSIKQHAYAH